MHDSTTSEPRPQPFCLTLTAARDASERYRLSAEQEQRVGERNTEI